MSLGRKFLILAVATLILNSESVLSQPAEKSSEKNDNLLTYKRNFTMPGVSPNVVCYIG